jgi:hypothetical protein
MGIKSLIRKTIKKKRNKKIKPILKKTNEKQKKNPTKKQIKIKETKNKTKEISPNMKLKETRKKHARNIMKDKRLNRKISKILYQEIPPLKQALNSKRALGFIYSPIIIGMKQLVIIYYENDNIKITYELMYSKVSPNCDVYVKLFEKTKEGEYRIMESRTRRFPVTGRTTPQEFDYIVKVYIISEIKRFFNKMKIE